MAHQDYVARSQKNKKKNNPYKPTQAKVESGDIKLKLLTLFALVAIGGFSYFLWTLSKVEPVESGLPALPKRAVTKSSGDELPAPPTEKWGYIEDLKHKEVAEGEYQVTSKGPYQMQCGSFKSQSQAQSLKANIAFTGIESQVRKTSGQNGVYYKVILGPYERKRDAERDKHKLQNNNINYCQIWLWR
jgi:cell division protein FtsN